jgi:hypothetical protein
MLELNNFKKNPKIDCNTERCTSGDRSKSGGHRRRTSGAVGGRGRAGRSGSRGSVGSSSLQRIPRRHEGAIFPPSAPSARRPQLHGEPRCRPPDPRARGRRRQTPGPRDGADACRHQRSSPDPAASSQRAFCRPPPPSSPQRPRHATSRARRSTPRGLRCCFSSALMLAVRPTPRPSGTASPLPCGRPRAELPADSLPELDSPRLLANDRGAAACTGCERK